HALANSLTIILALILLKDKNKFLFYGVNLWLFIIIAVLSLIAIFVYQEEKQKSIFSEIIYKIVIFLGKAAVAFSIIFIFALFSFYANKPLQFWLILGFWAVIFLAISTNILISIQDYLFSKKKETFLNQLGKIIEEHSPGLITIKCYRGIGIKSGDYIFIIRERVFVYKTFKILFVEDDIYCKVALVDELDIKEVNITNKYSKNEFYSLGDEEKLKVFIKEPSRVEILKNYVGLIVEQTDINAIRFQVIADIKLEEGYVLLCRIGGKNILYQIVNVCLSLDRISENTSTGTIIGIAQQIGDWDSKKVKFDKYGWIPKLYSPIFLVDQNYKVEFELKKNEIVLGCIPNTNFPIIANIDTLVTHHSAILGITGSGKTELAFTIIAKMIECKTKVFCVDFTGDYFEEFKDFNPERITIPSEKAEELNQKLFDVETGKFGAAEEKKSLDGYKQSLTPVIAEMVKKFIESEKNLGIFELAEISNTSATIAMTELYISSLFKYAREHRKDQRKYCIVLEEAHTIIPEDRTMGVEDKFSKATIGKICQIALQGRKYKVGLLVIAQRTANVTKTVLNQCNSIMIFSSFDKTGFDFMENYVGRDMIQAIPNLKFLQGIVAGRCFKSGRPVIMEIPRKDKFTDTPIETDE
ncbi:MAG: DUF87 domain-containing protein, partial [Candidatus Omnitrophica bacterium]|nr:DUF87 domain-containing protein [Candidatus Omnitrophota bacterium]